MQPGVASLPFTKYRVSVFATLDDPHKKSFVQQLQRKMFSLGVKYLVIITPKPHDPDNWCFEMHRLGTKKANRFFRERFVTRVRNKKR